MPARRLPTLPDPAAPKLPAAVTSAVGFLTREVAGLFKARFEAVLRAHRLGPRQYLILLLLRDEGPMSQQAVGQRLGMDRTTTMQTVQGLAESGLVERLDDPSDRRVYRVVPSPGAAALATRLQAQLHAMEAEMLAPLSPAARETFIAALQDILRHHHGDAAGECATHGTG